MAFCVICCLNFLTIIHYCIFLCWVITFVNMKAKRFLKNSKWRCNEQCACFVSNRFSFLLAHFMTIFILIIFQKFVRWPTGGIIWEVEGRASGSKGVAYHTDSWSTLRLGLVRSVWYATPLLPLPQSSTWVSESVWYATPLLPLPRPSTSQIIWPVCWLPFLKPFSASLPYG